MMGGCFAIFTDSGHNLSHARRASRIRSTPTPRRMTQQGTKERVRTPPTVVHMNLLNGGLWWCWFVRSFVFLHLGRLRRCGGHCVAWQQSTVWRCPSRASYSWLTSLWAACSRSHGGWAAACKLWLFSFHFWQQVLQSGQHRDALSASCCSLSLCLFPPSTSSASTQFALGTLPRPTIIAYDLLSTVWFHEHLSTVDGSGVLCIVLFVLLNSNLSNLLAAISVLMSTFLSWRTRSSICFLASAFHATHFRINIADGAACSPHLQTQPRTCCLCRGRWTINLCRGLVARTVMDRAFDAQFHWLSAESPATCLQTESLMRACGRVWNLENLRLWWVCVKMAGAMPRCYAGCVQRQGTQQGIAQAWRWSLVGQKRQREGLTHVRSCLMHADMRASGCRVPCSTLFRAAHGHDMASDTLHDNINIWFDCTVSGCLVRFLRRGDIDFEHPLASSSWRCILLDRRDDRKQARLWVLGRQALLHFTALHSHRGIRDDHTSRDEESICSAAESFLCRALSLSDPLATVRQKLEVIRTDHEYYCGGNGYAYLIRVTSERLIIGAVFFFTMSGHSLAQTQDFCRTSPPSNETSITNNLRDGAAGCSIPNKYGASQWRFW